jgi:imidazoleglycerol-phosphate dehydratase
MVAGSRGKKIGKSRKKAMSRKTRETSISLTLNLDGTAKTDICSGIGFFDHMMELCARHALWNLKLRATGDRQVDDHHLVEDTGILLGQALCAALGNKKGVSRYGWSRVPMDEAMAEVALDLSGRSYLHLEGVPGRGKVGSFELELVEEFLRALSDNAKMTLHVSVLRGRNRHHIIESIFKSLGRALRAAASIDPREPGIPSTKGKL